MNRFVKHSSGFEINWPKTPKMQTTWWQVLIAIGDGVETAPEIIDEIGDSICADCEHPGKRVGTIAKTLDRLGLVKSVKIKGQKLTRYSLTDFGEYCFAAYEFSPDKSRMIVARKHNLSPVKAEPTKYKKMIDADLLLSGWVNFLTRSLTPAGDAA